jgi:transposase
MEWIGIDLHKTESQICILEEDGGVFERRIKTSSDRFRAVLGCRPPARVLLEASTESEWVARLIEGMGHEVIVADPNFAAMYATRSRKVKTDRRDARTLAEACRLGAYRAAHRTSEKQTHARATLTVRDVLVRSRSRLISVARALLRREGLRLPSGEAESFVSRVETLSISPALLAEIGPIVTLLPAITDEINELDRDIAATARMDPVTARLQTAPAVGPIIATAFAATIDDPHRFRGAHQVQAYLGLVPSEMSSGEKQKRGHITKAGNPRVRWLLVQAAWSILRSTRRDSAALREWAMAVASRRGKRVAVVALARRLAGVLFAMMRDETAYDPPRLRAVA